MCVVFVKGNRPATHVGFNGKRETEKEEAVNSANISLSTD